MAFHQAHISWNAFRKTSVDPEVFWGQGERESSDSRLTQRLQLLHRLLPYRLNVDACKAPLRGHFDQVRPVVARWKHVAVKLCVVKQVLAVCKVPGPGGATQNSGGKTVSLFLDAASVSRWGLDLWENCLGLQLLYSSWFMLSRGRYALPGTLPWKSKCLNKHKARDKVNLRNTN